jgi:predicted RNA-binding Zn-ribbon protein involved in translation (DUF1610 family)
MNELSHTVPLYCSECGEIVEPEEGEDGFLHYYCDECEKFVSPRSQPPKDLSDDDADR